MMINRVDYNVQKEKKAEPISLDYLYGYLKQFSLSDSLYVIGLLNAAMKIGYEDEEYWNEGIPQPIIDFIKVNCKERSSKLRLYLTIARLARFLVLSPANDYKNKILDVGTPEFNRATNLTYALYDKDIEIKAKTPIDIAQKMGRHVQWQFPLQSRTKDIFGRGLILFLNLPSEITTEYDFDKKMSEYYGLGIYEFIASGFALWMKSNSILMHDLTVEVDELKDVVTKESLKKFIELSSGTSKDYKVLVRGEEWTKVNKLLDIYGLDPFVRMPALKIEKSTLFPSGFYVVPQSLYFLQRTSSGIFYLLSDKEREIGQAAGNKGQNHFRNSFGDIYRAYVGKHLELANEAETFIDIDKGFNDIGKKPDFAIVTGDVCVLFEVKTTLLTINSRTLFDEEKIRKELSDGSFKKAVCSQLASFTKLILEGKTQDDRFNGVTRVIKVLVGYEDIFTANAMLLPILEELYPEDTTDLQIATISDIEVVGVSLAFNEDFCLSMIEKIDRGQKSYGISSFLNTRNGINHNNPILGGAFDNFMEKITGVKREDIDEMDLI